MDMRHTNGRLIALCGIGLLVFALGAPAFGQAPQYPAPAPIPAQQQPAQQPLMPPEQLDNLVAPIALYPDPLLGQVLAASTYPLEVVEANQWLNQNRNLQGQALMDAARQQNWDPSVQALVAFPDVLTLLNSDVHWMTDLGNAFLAQQQDVMAAVQRMRVRAQANGRLSSDSQQTVTTQTQNGQSAVVIEPASPEYIYVPVYNPDYIWGAPDWGYYPPLWYPPYAYGFGFLPGIYLGGFFPGWGFGWGGWGFGWGWGCGWFGGGLFVNVGFFNHWGFHGYFGNRFAGGFGAGRLGWEHDPFHRAGVGYTNRAVASRFSSSPRFAEGRAAAGGNFSAGRGNTFAGNRGGSAAGGGWQHFGGNASTASRGFTAPTGGAQSYRGNYGSSFNSARSFSPSRSYSAPRSYAAPSYSAPRSYGGGGFSGGARSFGGGGVHSFGGSGGHSFGGGGGHGGGGHR